MKAHNLYPKIKVLLPALVLFFSLMAAPSALAWSLRDAFGGQFFVNPADKAGYNVVEDDPNPLIARVITVMLSFLGVIFLVLMIYGGFTWMTAAGDEEKVRTARKLVQAAVIGLIIVAAAYAITIFVLDRIVSRTVNL